MSNKEFITKLQQALPWKSFIASIKKFGFFELNNISEFIKENNNKILHGYGMIINNSIQTGPLKDPSLLYLEPYILFRPSTENQLRLIINKSQCYKIPISFCSGKTGLSGGYSNYGILVDLTNLHSFKTPILFSPISEVIHAEQGVLVSDLIKFVSFKTRNELIFPIQPSSACKLPVRVGGIVSTDASGITSGKLGSAGSWIEEIRMMSPEGNIKTINNEDPLFSKILGGNGYYGVVLAASFRLYRPSKENKNAIIYGSEINKAFNGLQVISERKIYPLVSEFVASLDYLPGKFKDLSNLSVQSNSIKWAVIIKGESEEINQFIQIMEEESNSSYLMLDEDNFESYLQERTKFGLLIQSQEKEEFLGFPGYEDILSDPKDFPKIIETINQILTNHRFHKLIFNYGHINFRKGKGLLLHVRLPVPISFFYGENKKKLNSICEIVYEVINTLSVKFNIQYKAEHSAGPFQVWMDPGIRDKLRRDISRNQAFVNPHLKIIDSLIEKKWGVNLEEDLNQLPDVMKKELFISAMELYLI